jgi:aspartate carbamoyltransferase catalytic subunit
MTRHLTGLMTLDAAEMRGLLTLAKTLTARPDVGSLLAGSIIANLFFEDSTRTRTSFSVAAHRLGANVVNLSGAESSLSKGETLVDTARNIEAMGVHALVVRAKQSGAAETIAKAVACSVINAGDGRHEHPTQGLLDAFTLATHLKRDGTWDLSGLRVAIVGDIVSSRVARSNIACLTALGAKVVCIGPPGMAPAAITGASKVAGACEVSHDLDGELERIDAAMMLRIQFERHGAAPTTAESHNPLRDGPKGGSLASVREYRSLYALTPERAAQMKLGAVVMHPGPINRGIELDACVADGPRSLILAQVAHGVSVRMAVLARCVLGI